MIEDDLKRRLALIEKRLDFVETHFSDAFWRTLDVAYEASLPTREIHCIVCDYSCPRAGFELIVDRCIFGGGSLERYRCPRCECIFGPQKYLDLDDEFVNRDYSLLYSKYSEADSTENEIRTFYSLKAAADGVYLNWGCGGGWSKSIARLRGEGWDVWGYEPSAGNESKFVVNDKKMISAVFNGIFSNNVIEHFRKPIDQFNYFHSILKPGATMAHSSPCYDYEYPFTRFHSLFLIGNSAHILAKRTGFEVIDKIIDREYINYIFMKKG